MSAADRIQLSKAVILAHQAPSGAFVASPSYAAYRYAWFRDGSFVAYALDRWGEHEHARRFYRWGHTVILKHADKARRAIAAAAAGEPVPEDARLHARYTVDGDEVPGEWGNFQLDGYGTWLWGLSEHVRLSGDAMLAEELRPSVELAADYLCACWPLPNFDCWEEFGDRIHPATLAAVYGGLRAVTPWLHGRREKLEGVCAAIQSRVLTDGVAEGVFVKSFGFPEVDASLLWLAVPFALADEKDERMCRTVERIEQELVHGWGVHRYRGDVYYGGGLWLLLSAWLGWYAVRTGDRAKAKAIFRWIEQRFVPEGLPEQVQDHLLAHEAYDEWVKRAGPPACPLLWSHGMHLVLAKELTEYGLQAVQPQST